MGRTHIAKVWIEFEPDDHEKMKKFIEKLGKFYYNMDDEERGSIYFQLSGHNGVDYAELEDIKEFCKKKKIPVEINAVEYCEIDEGFYYNSEEDEEEED
jgi:hypothetical protein